MEAQNIKTIETYFSALAAGDMATFSSLFADDVVWVQPGNNAFSGIKKGFNEVGAMVGGMMETSGGSFVVKPTSNPMANNDFVSIAVTFSGKTQTSSIDMTGVDLFQLKDNKIVGVWLFSDDQAAEDQFWGK
ncbi:ketosteroid isomerase [Enterovibrio norvegicus]|uniref:Nuclear transport factor 2 family protein n=1 Tax=Enterovibrio norvegicus TaxID=188144 RepID=A0ABV4L900_9GAMM|nr:nuclear transport factor 2 family protein [Enterovibrio norvegicus]MCC4796755.1 nuclear transport factor 2 family protein [Enterovibrio norvegicus]OEE57108.1 ketosteroid isomerase [Enterovibrio norvegicus]OEF55598.1 ketosteroid isomerase [Enterovibrio norvegicus]PMH62678.1 ketosteroid isomerase [Enterovibrio norvegicus]PMI34597.1 ketosteroid isomerase [Enterovibrio norvegicus]